MHPKKHKKNGIRCAFHQLTKKHACEETCSGRIELHFEPFPPLLAETIQLHIRQWKGKEQKLEECIELVHKIKCFDDIDFHRAWGFQLLTRDDIAWRSPTFLQEIANYSIPTGILLYIAKMDIRDTK